jgi:hypothetical protein
MEAQSSLAVKRRPKVGFSKLIIHGPVSKQNYPSLKREREVNHDSTDG